MKAKIKPRILHFLIDEKFNSIIVERFEELNSADNTFIVCSDKTEIKFTNIGEKIRPLPYFKCVELMTKFEFIVFHCSTPIHHQLACKLSKTHSSALISWGPGTYELKTMGLRVYEPKTLKELKRIHKKENSRFKIHLHSALNLLPKKILYLYYNYKTGQIHPENAYNITLNKIDYISTILPKESKSLYPNTRADYLPFLYGNIEQLLGGAIPEPEFPELGKNVMVGHSGFLYNNQIDALYKLHDYGYKGKILLPTNYGEDKDNSVYNLAIQLFGRNVISPQYMPTNKYLKVLLSCHSIVLNNRIQQGMGTLYTGLLLGMKIYLNEDGLLYDYCRGNNLNVYSFSKDFAQINSMQPLANDKKIQNREIVSRLIGKERIIENNRKFLLTLTNTD